MHISCSSDSFASSPSELEPTIPKKQRQRAMHAIKHAASLIMEDTEDLVEKKGCCESLNRCHKKKDEEQVNEEEEDATSTKISPEMQKASNQGMSMVKSIIFPSLPAVLQDLWVYLELIISIMAFVFGLVDIFPIQIGFAFNYTYFALATTSMTLALADGFIYFFQLGSCARGIHACRRKLRERRQRDETLQIEEGNEEHDDDKYDKRIPKCCRLSKKWKRHFMTWFELGRNILTELVLYPLLIFDMFSFITKTVYQPSDALGRADFSLFVIGGFYLILAVYIMRIFMVAGSMISLIQIPIDKEATSDSNNSLLLRFCAHIVGQIIVHFMVILVVGTKINNENRESQNNMMNMTLDGNGTVLMNMPLMDMNMPLVDSGDEGGGTNASPFLITAIVLGGIIPLAGVLAFFSVNYYWMMEFSVGLWLNMISLLRGKNFAEAVFGGEGLSSAEENVREFMEKAQYQKVKKQLKQFKAPSVWTKFFFPVRVPLTAVSGLLYDIALLTFITCLMLTYKGGVVKFIIFTDDTIMTVVFMISVTIIILANIHVLILLNLVLFIVVLIFAVAGVLALFLSPILLFVYFPIAIYLCYFILFYEAGVSLKKRKREDLSKPPHVSNDRNRNIEIDIVEMTTSLDTKDQSAA